MTYEHARERLRIAKDIPLIGLIRELGYDIDSDGSYYSMLSPFRSEGQGSLKISKKNPNKWKDFGNGKRGDVLDFVCELFSLSTKDSIDYLLKRTNIPLPVYDTIKKDTNAIEIVSIEPLSHPKLMDYITSRKMGLNQAKRYLSQAIIKFPNGKNPDREHLVLAWKNNSGGYEFRNSFIKLSNSPKDVTNIKGDIPTKGVTFIFEGWPDFLSFLTYFKITEALDDCIILNTISFLEVIIPFIKEKRDILYYGQNDTAGDKAFRRLKETCGCVIDRRDIYAGYKDFNDYLCNKPMKKKTMSIKEILNNN